MAVHDAAVGATDEWYTPHYVFEALGCTFDMDVSAPRDRTFVSTPTNYWIVGKSLAQKWNGFIWMNPPFGARNGITPWLEKFFQHGNGIALTPDRTSAPWWQEFAARAEAILFVSPKIKFIGADGNQGKSPSDGTSLLAVGPLGVSALQRAAAKGLGKLMLPANLQAAE